MPAQQPRSHPAPQRPVPGRRQLAWNCGERCPGATAIAEVVVRCEIHALGEAQLPIASLGAEAIKQSGPATGQAHASPGSEKGDCPPILKGTVPFFRQAANGTPQARNRPPSPSTA